MKRALSAGTAFLAVLSTFVGACASDAEQQSQPVVLGMTDKLAPFYDDGTVQIFQVQTPVNLPVRRPTDAERTALGPAGAGDPYPRQPFFLANDARITVKYTLTNLDAKSSHVVELLLDPWNEFVRYTPGTQVANEQVQPNLSGIDRYVVLPALGRVEGILNPDDLTELAIDLATVENIAKAPADPTSAFNGPVLYNHAFNVQNRSNHPDPLIDPYIPKTTAGLTGFDLGLRTGEAANIAVELSIDVTDLNGNRIIPPSDTTTKPFGPPGTRLAPPPPAPPPP